MRLIPKMQSDEEVSHLIPLEVILGEYPSLLPEVALNLSCFPPEAAAVDASAAELSSNSCIWFVSRTMVSSFTWRSRGRRNENILIEGIEIINRPTLERSEPLLIGKRGPLL